MVQWQQTLDIAEDDGRTLVARIASALVAEITGGRLHPGEALPGTRALSGSLGVHRNTVLAAYETLIAEGWLVTERARATRVATNLPITQPKRFASGRASRNCIAERAGFDVAPGPVLRERELPRGCVALYGGQPDVSLFPIELYLRELRRAMRLRGVSLLDYGSAFGHPKLRDALATMLSALRGLAATRANVLVTRGSQQALDLLARAIVRPGDEVMVEALGYAPAWAALRAAGAVVTALPVDRHGASIDALAQRCLTAPPRLIYLTPHHQYPTGVTLSASRRLMLLSLAKKHRICIVEDDYDHEFHYEGRPVLPIASADREGLVLYVGTLSKLLAPGLRTGYVVGPAKLIETLAAHRTYNDRQGDLASEVALATLIEDGTVAHHARRARAVYRERRDALVRSLSEFAGNSLVFDIPRGGLALWAKLRTLKGADAVIARCSERSLLIQSTRALCFDGRDRGYLRLGFGGNDSQTLARAAKTLGSVVADL
ncbi:MAG: PLP-dependent aminotransferase family protein [Deltaproteobacteria bacterium]|nr:PLP-dependent aminotransferase family protein [Deltaproteobacteria bacterium]